MVVGQGHHSNQGGGARHIQVGARRAERPMLEAAVVARTGTNVAGNRNQLGQSLTAAAAAFAAVLLGTVVGSALGAEVAAAVGHSDLGHLATAEAHGAAQGADRGERLTVAPHPPS